MLTVNGILRGMAGTLCTLVTLKYITQVPGEYSPKLFMVLCEKEKSRSKWSNPYYFQTRTAQKW